MTPGWLGPSELSNMDKNVYDGRVDSLQGSDVVSTARGSHSLISFAYASRDRLRASSTLFELNISRALLRMWLVFASSSSVELLLTGVDAKPFAMK